LATLSEREAGIVRLRFGLAEANRALDQIGHVYGLTRERIRQIESTTMTKLRHPAGSQPLRYYLDRLARYPTGADSRFRVRLGLTIPGRSHDPSTERLWVALGIPRSPRRGGGRNTKQSDDVVLCCRKLGCAVLSV
jgi:hypothetical protein